MHVPRCALDRAIRNNTLSIEPCRLTAAPLPFREVHKPFQFDRVIAISIARSPEVASSLRLPSPTVSRTFTTGVGVS